MKEFVNIPHTGGLEFTLTYYFKPADLVEGEQPTGEGGKTPHTCHVENCTLVQRVHGSTAALVLDISPHVIIALADRIRDLHQQRTLQETDY